MMYFVSFTMSHLDIRIYQPFSPEAAVFFRQYPICSRSALGEILTRRPFMYAKSL